MHHEINVEAGTRIETLLLSREQRHIKNVPYCVISSDTADQIIMRCISA